MNLQLLLVPALGGYWLLTRTHTFKFHISRESGYHLFFSVALCGAILLVAARICVFWISKHVPVSITHTWANFAPFEYSDTIAMSVVLAVLFPIVSNRFTDEKEAAMKAARLSGDFIELVLQESTGQGLVEISMKSGKSYVGLVKESGVDVRVDCDVILIPIMSGYRETNTRELKFTTNYANVFSNWEGNLDDFQVVLPATEIMSARHFDPGAYNYFREQEQERGAPQEA